MLDDLVRLGTNCARMARFMIDSLKFRADILYNVYREMRWTYRALIATAAQSMVIDDAAITREERQMSRHGADDQCGAVIAYRATYYLSRNWQCSFCGASGVVYTRGRALNESGQDQWMLQFFCDAQIATVITHFYRKGTNVHCGFSFHGKSRSDKI